MAAHRSRSVAPAAGSSQARSVTSAPIAAPSPIGSCPPRRTPSPLTQFVRLRVIDPEGAYWRRGIEAATGWLRETGSSELRNLSGNSDYLAPVIGLGAAAAATGGTVQVRIHVR